MCRFCTAAQPRRLTNRTWLPYPLTGDGQSRRLRIDEQMCRIHRKDGAVAGMAQASASRPVVHRDPLEARYKAGADGKILVEQSRAPGGCFYLPSLSKSLLDKDFWVGWIICLVLTSAFDQRSCFTSLCWKTWSFLVAWPRRAK